MLSFTRRSTRFGLPIGPRRTDWNKVARAGAGVVAFIAGMGIMRRFVRATDDELPRDETGRFLPRSEDEEDEQSRERAAGHERRAG